MTLFKIDSGCAGNLHVYAGDGPAWYYITAEYGLVSFKIGGEVCFASGKVGHVVTDTVESVDVENQTVTLTEYGNVELKHWEYFARI